MQYCWSCSESFIILNIIQRALMPSKNVKFIEFLHSFPLKMLFVYLMPSKNLLLMELRDFKQINIQETTPGLVQ